MTAVEFLIEQIESCKITMYNDGDRKKLISLVIDDLIEQAKAMEKQQIINAVSKGWDNYENGLVRWIGEQHYNETFK
jgi:hypothetical protein